MDVTGFNVEILPIDDLPIVEGVIQDIYVAEDFSQNQIPNWNENLNEVFFDIDGELEYSVSFINPDIVDAIVSRHDGAVQGSRAEE